MAYSPAVEIKAIADWLATQPANPSADLCIRDALALVAKEDYEHAAQRALKAITYSAGIFSSQYRLARAVLQGVA